MSAAPGSRRMPNPRVILRRFVPVATRAGWGLADQALSSATNFALGILVARTLPLDQFGAFSLAFSAYLVAMNMTRAFPMQPVAIRFSGGTVESWRRASADALGTALAAGVVIGLGFVVLGVTVGGTLGPAFVALGLTLPGLLVQDAWRAAFFAGRRGSLAFMNDLAWAVVLFPSLLGLVALGPTSVFWLTIAWGTAATVAAIFGCVQIGLVPRPDRAAAWWREQRDLGGRYLIEAAVSTGANQGAMFGIGIVAGLGAVGAFRAALLLFGPLQVFYIGISLVIVPEGVSALQRSVGHLVRVSAWLSVFLAVGALVWGVLLLVIPGSIGLALLGAAWFAAAPLFGPLALSYAGLMAATGAQVTLRALANARRSLRASLSAAAAYALVIVGAALSGSYGAAWGSVAASWVGVVAWSWQSRIGVHEFTEPTDLVDEPGGGRADR